MKMSASGLGVVCVLAVACGAWAQQDNDVQWDGVSHLVADDLRPLVPMRNDAFSVRVQAFRNDLTGVRVTQDVGGSLTTVDAVVVGQVGPYDVWQADLPGTGDDTLTYTVELIDGTDVDYLGPNGVSDNAPAGGFALDFATLSHAREGATPVSAGAVFKVWSPSRTTCNVRGEFNGWSTANPLTKVGEHFIGYVPGASVGQMYKYYFNNAVWNTDPRAPELNPGDNYNAFIRDPLAYNWQNDGFIADPLNELVIYQLHVGTFAGRNDPFGPTSNPSGYRDVGDRAAHLAELGVNAVMLNPVNEFPGDFSGGYAPVSMFAWESAFGEPDDLKYMVDQLHAHGIAVLLDVVWNHFSVSDNFLWDFDGTQLYFDSPHQDTPWGAQADFDEDGVFRYFIESVHHVMGEYRMDGYRQDAVMAMTDSGWTAQWASGQALMNEMNDVISQRYTDAHTIAEIYIDSPWVQTGIGFDSQYHNSFKNSLRDAVFNAAFGSSNVSSVAAAVDGTGGVSGTQVMNYFELHDDAWPLNGHERAVRDIDTTPPHDDEFAAGRTKLANGLVLLSKGVPAILQGTEWLEDDGWESSKIDWAHKTAYSEVFRFYQDLIGLRTTKPALFADAGVDVFHVNEAADVFAFERSGSDGRSYVVIANFSNTDFNGYALGLPRSGQWGVIVDSEASIYGGDGFGQSGAFNSEPIARHGFAQSASIDLAGHSVMVIQHEPEFIGCSPADLNGDQLVNGLDVGLFLSAYAGQQPAADFNGDGLYNGLDVGLFLSAYAAGC